ncbi:MFS transporter [Parasphingopyxis algicola]|uniref:MFS transporter n=1 Tax=Parasphingopyxis algicola TaxID=2026624 RepID=UPI00159FA606|nr:MFS transporter [Parasphingopyxis algicola]QLC25690.1 MFS transporter [Parasphingopyxis algicola]
MPLPRFLRAYYAYVFLFDFMLGYAIYTVYFQLSGLDVWGIALLFVIWSAVAAAFEMPSGALADHFDRRWQMMAAPLVKATAFAIWALAGGSFALFAIGFVVWSFADSLVSGCKQALLYEHMEAAGQADDYDRILGRDRALVEISAGIALVLGGIVGHFSMPLALWLAIPPLALASIVAFWLPDIRLRSDAGEEKPGYLSHFAEALGEFRRSADLRFITAYLTLGIMLFGVLEEFDPLYYLAVGMPIWTFGLIGALAIAAYAAANVAAYRFAGFRAGGWLFPLVAGLFLFTAGIAESAWLLIPLMLAYICAAPVWVLGEAKFQRVMSGASRATTTSTMMFFHCLASIGMSLAIGGLALTIGLIPAYGWCGIYLIAFSAWAWWRDRRGQSAI